MMPPDHNEPASSLGCGQRLRRAREAAGLSRQDVATQLKIPARVVESLEAEDWSRLGAPVFIRGQLRSYGRLLGLATATIQAVSGVEPVRPVELKPRTYVPRMRLVAEQATRRLIYAVITGAIALPVWLATQPHLAQQEPLSGSLDVPNWVHDVPEAVRGPKALVASMAPATLRFAAPPRPTQSPGSAPTLSPRADEMARDGRHSEPSPALAPAPENAPDGKATALPPRLPGAQ